MTSLQATKDPPLRGVSPTPSKIPVLSQRRLPLPTGNPFALDQENQDPSGLVQKPPLSNQGPLDGPAGSRPKVMHQTKKSERLVGSTQLRNPLKDLRGSPGGQNVGPGPPSQTEAPGAVEFVADPAALATILSGEGLKSCRLGRQPSLAQRVLIRGSQGSTIRRGQGARASAYSAPKTPIHRLDPARASCFSRLEGPGPRSRTLCPQKLETLIPPSGPSFHPSTRPSFQELRRETGGRSRTSVNQASGLPLKNPAQSASSLPERERDAMTHSDEGRGGPLGLAQRIPLREICGITHIRDGRESHLMPSPAPAAQPMPGRVVPPTDTHPSPFGWAQRVPSPHPSTLRSYSVLRRLAICPKTQFTPIPSVPKIQQAQWVSGLSPQACPEEPVLPWEQIAVRLFEQESCVSLQEGPGKPPVATPNGPHPNFQELKMQRISILQQLLRQEVEGLAEGEYAPLNGGSSLDMIELQPLLAEIPRTQNAPEHNSGTSHPPGLLQPSEDCGESQPCPAVEPEEAQPSPPIEPGSPKFCHSREPEVPESLPQEQPEVPAPLSQEQPEVPEPCPPAEPGPLQPSPQGKTGPPGPCPRDEPGASESSQQSCCSQWAPATTSLIFSSQRPLCASPLIRSLQSLKPPTGQSGPSSLAPRTRALRQRLTACLTAIHCFHEARLDDECAFYTSRAPPLGPTRVCTNPVATLLEWQDALCFIPVGSAAPHGFPS